MNIVIQTGRLTKDPETRKSANGDMTITRFNVAVPRDYKREGEPDADFVNCTAFGKTAEFVDKYFSKGMRIFYVGRMQTGSYTNKDGVKVYTTDVIVDRVEFGESKRGEATNNSTDEFMTVPDGIDEELPFS